MKRIVYASLMMLAVATLILPAHAQRSEWWVVKPGGERVEGIKITADDSGNLTVQLDERVSTRVRWGDYVKVNTPRPNVINQLTQLSQAGQHERVIDAAGKLFDSSLKFLGWADEIQAAAGNSYLATNQYSKAAEAFQQGLKFTFDDEDKAKLVRGLIEAYVGQKDFDEASKMVEQLSVKDPQMAAYRFNVKGRLLEQSGDQRGAVLNHLKVIMLYKDAADIRKQSYEDVIRLMKAMNDRRYMDFEKEMEQEFG